MLPKARLRTSVRLAPEGPVTQQLFKIKNRFPDPIPSDSKLVVWDGTWGLYSDQAAQVIPRSSEAGDSQDWGTWLSPKAVRHVREARELEAW